MGSVSRASRRTEQLSKVDEAKAQFASLSDEVLLNRGGLDSDEVLERRQLGLDNKIPDLFSRSVGQILRSNLLTLFNLVLGICLILVLIVGSWRDAFFGLVVVLNAAIGVIQEGRAKRTLDRLAVLNAPHARVLRHRQEHEIRIEEVVFDDLLVLRAGDQISADAVALQAEGLEIGSAA